MIDTLDRVNRTKENLVLFRISRPFFLDSHHLILWTVSLLDGFSSNGKKMKRVTSLSIARDVEPERTESKFVVLESKGSTAITGQDTAKFADIPTNGRQRLLPLSYILGGATPDAPNDGRRKYHGRLHSTYLYRRPSQLLRNAAFCMVSRLSAPSHVAAVDRPGRRRRRLMIICSTA
jgi:hypothetical protein